MCFLNSFYFNQYTSDILEPQAKLLFLVSTMKKVSNGMIGVTGVNALAAAEKEAETGPEHVKVQIEC